MDNRMHLPEKREPDGVEQHERHRRTKRMHDRIGILIGAALIFGFTVVGFIPDLSETVDSVTSHGAVWLAAAIGAFLIGAAWFPVSERLIRTRWNKRPGAAGCIVYTLLFTVAAVAPIVLMLAALFILWDAASGLGVEAWMTVSRVFGVGISLGFVIMAALWYRDERTALVEAGRT
jgi:MFS family permease